MLRFRSGNDGRGAYAPLSSKRNPNEVDDFTQGSAADCSEYHSTFDSDDSNISELSLEYGDNQLHDEYGEISNRLNDAKVEVEAKDFFEKEDNSWTDISKGAKKKMKKISDIVRKFKKKRRRVKIECMSSSGMSRDSRLSGRSMKSHISSILSSSSEDNDDSHESTSSDEEDEDLEIENEMMDMKLVESKIRQTKNIDKWKHLKF